MINLSLAQKAKQDYMLESLKFEGFSNIPRMECYSSDIEALKNISPEDCLTIETEKFEDNSVLVTWIKLIERDVI